MLASPPGLNVKEAEINLSKSRVVGKNNQFPLDWGTIRSLFSGYGPGEKEIYGIQVYFLIFYFILFYEYCTYFKFIIIIGYF